LIGVYTGTNSPGTVTANSGIMALRFKSDPFVNNAGWTATWSCTATTGMNEPGDEQAVRVYPNPFSDMANVRWQKADGNSQDIQIKIFDLMGKEVHPPVIRNADSFVIHRQGLSSGVYFYKLENGDQMISAGKLIIE
jgi:hypothetical protein